MTTSDQGDDHGPVTDADGVIQAEYDWSLLAPSTAVIETVAIATNREPTGLDSLFETVDPEALDALVRSSGPHTTERDVTVRFGFAGHDVTVQNNGMVVIEPDGSRHESE